MHTKIVYIHTLFGWVYTVYYLKTLSSATSELWDKKIIFIKRVYAEGTIFMKPAVVKL